MKTVALIQGLRFVDSFFPSGGFAFSSGLEAAVHDGAVRDGNGLFRYVEDLLVNGISRREAVAVAVGHQAASAAPLETALQADRALDALKVGREGRLASRQMGRQVMKVSAGERPEHRRLRGFRQAIEEQLTPGHFPVSLGLTLAACGWSRQDAVAAYLYQTAQGFAAAAMKLLPVGQHEGQQLLHRWSPLIAELSRTITPHEELVSWSPVQDIYAMRHARLESRLFRS